MMKQLSLSKGGNGAVIQGAFRFRKNAIKAVKFLDLNEDDFTVSTVNGRSANGSNHRYFRIDSKRKISDRLFRSIDRRINSVVFDSQRAATRQQRRAKARVAAKQPTAFVASIATLEAIINTPRNKRTGNRIIFSGKRKKQSHNEKKLQKAAKNYVESLGREIIIVQWDHSGNPDHLYLIPRKGLWFVVAAEFKDLGKKPERHQAKKILGLLNKMPVEVISDIKTFKTWFDRVTA